MSNGIPMMEIGKAHSQATSVIRFIMCPGLQIACAGGGMHHSANTTRLPTTVVSAPAARTRARQRARHCGAGCLANNILMDPQLRVGLLDDARHRAQPEA